MHQATDNVRRVLKERAEKEDEELINLRKENTYLKNLFLISEEGNEYEMVRWLKGDLNMLKLENEVWRERVGQEQNLTEQFRKERDEALEELTALRKSCR